MLARAIQNFNFAELSSDGHLEAIQERRRSSVRPFMLPLVQCVAERSTRLAVAPDAFKAYNASMQPAESSVATLTIRNVDAALKERLRVRAAQHGHSMEAEVRQILETTLAEPEKPPEPNLAEAIRRRFAPLGGVDLEPPPGETVGEPPSFDP